MSDKDKTSQSKIVNNQNRIRFENGVEANINRMLTNYRGLVKKYATLTRQESVGRHEKLQIETMSESIVS